MAAKARTASNRNQAGKWKEQPVRVVLHDGRHYVGWIRGIERGQLILTGVPDCGGNGSSRSKPASRNGRKTKISALLPTSASGAAAAADVAPASGVAGGGGFLGLAGLEDWMGFMQKTLPMIRMGVDMVKTIMPLLGGLKG